MQKPGNALHPLKNEKAFEARVFRGFFYLLPKLDLSEVVIYIDVHFLFTETLQEASNGRFESHSHAAHNF